VIRGTDLLWVLSHFYNSADPCGSTFAPVTQGAIPKIHHMKNQNPVGWFDIPVANLERAKAFYGTVFQITLVDLPGQWGRQALFPFDPTGANISGALVEMPDLRHGSNATVVYFETADCEAEEARIVRAGGEVLRPKMAIGEFGFVSIFRDTEGNTVGLHSRR
jgi:hypothetical protein